MRPRIFSFNKADYLHPQNTGQAALNKLALVGSPRFAESYSTALVRTRWLRRGAKSWR